MSEALTLPERELPEAASRAGIAAIATIAAKVAGAAGALAINIAVARILGADGYGIYAFGVGLGTTLAVVASLGMPFAAIRHVPDYLAQRDWSGIVGFTRASLLVSLAGAAACAALLLLMPRLAGATPAVASGLAWSAALLLPVTLGQTIATLLQARGHVVRPEIVQSAVRQGATLVLLGALLLAFPGQVTPGTAIAATALANVGSALALAYMLRRIEAREPREAGRYELRRWARTGGSVLLILVSAALNERVDVLMLGWLVEPAALGQYAAAARLASVATIALAGLNAAYMPRVSRAWAEGDRPGTQRLLQEVALLGVGLTGAMVLGAVALGEPALGLFGPEFRDAQSVLLLLLLTQCGIAVAGIASGLAVVAGLDHLALCGVLAGLAVNVLLNLLLTPAFGIVGAAIATLVALVGTQLAVALRCGQLLGLGTTIFALLRPERTVGRAAGE